MTFLEFYLIGCALCTLFIAYDLYITDFIKEKNKYLYIFLVSIILGLMSWSFFVLLIYAYFKENKE